MFVYVFVSIVCFGFSGLSSALLPQGPKRCRVRVSVCVEFAKKALAIFVAGVLVPANDFTVRGMARAHTHTTPYYKKLAFGATRLLALVP